MDKYRSTIRFGRLSDPSNDLIENWNLRNGLPEPVAVIGMDGGTYQKATSTFKDKKFSQFLSFI